MDGIEEARIQLSEIELLLSMFPSKEELIINDQLAFAELRDYVDGRANDPPSSSAQFTIQQRLESANENMVMFSLSCTYPLKYPAVLPEIVVRSSELSRSKQAQLHRDLNAYLNENCCGDVCVLTTVEWLKENASVFFNKDPSPAVKKQADTPLKGSIFTRLWIYSHHIYNKQKRKNILDWSKELKLTGFSLPGKPGIVCVEGSQIICEEFWARLRRLTWQRILIRHREDIPLDNNCVNIDAELEKQRRFTGFEETIFDIRGNRGNHMDLGQLYHFLNEKGIGDVFQLYFGIEGR